MNDVTYRKATISDTAKLTEIYNQAIRTGNCTCDIYPVTVDARKMWVESHLCQRYPLYVCEVKGEVVGYGYLSEYRFGRPAVSSTAEVSYYIDFKWHCRGLGTGLLRFLKSEAQKIGFETLIAILLGSNAPSIGLLKKCGFEQWGLLPGIVKIGNHRTDHVYYGMNLEVAKDDLSQ